MMLWVFVDVMLHYIVIYRTENYSYNKVYPRKIWEYPSFTKEVNPQLAKRPLKTNGRLANRELTSLVKEARVSDSLFV